jgi:tetratricopeptide (TPR) repeat protein
LTRFLEQHPHTRLRSEAEALLGDLAAADGRVDDALRAYAAAQEAGAELDPPHVGYINHAVFQAGRLLAANQRWAEMAAWFGEYIDRWGANGQLSEALYEQGRALRALGRSDELLESWRRALWRFGNDPHDLGADLILREYPATYHRERGEWPVAELADALAEAREGQQGTLALRLAYALWTVNPTEDVRPMVFEDELPLASVAVLAQVAEAEQERNPDLARAAAQAAIERAPQHAFAEPAWHVLGALEAAAGEVEAALEAFRQAAQRFPNSARTARARLREGDLLRAAGRTEEAIAAYRTVLQTRQWRGVAWAEANYKIGLAHFEAGEWKEAFGFYQRVYVLYGSVVEWAAPAYLQSGLALERMGRAEEAVATYRELLARDELNQTVAAYEARRRWNGAR